MLNSVQAIQSCELTAAESLRAQYVTFLHYITHVTLLHCSIVTLRILHCYIAPLLHYAYYIVTYYIVTLHMLHC